MIDNGLLGKVVKTDNYHFIGFLYPNFPFVGHLAFTKKQGFIYSGNEHLKRCEKGIVNNFHSKEDLNEVGIPFIATYSVNGEYEIDLRERKTVLDLVYSRWGLDYKQYLDSETLRMLFDMGDMEFYDFVKLRWLFEELCVNIENIGLYNSKAIAKLLNMPVEKVYAEILTIESDITLESLELSIADFIANSKGVRYNQNRTDDYNVMMKTLDCSTRGKEKELAIILSKYRNMNHNIKIKLVWLILELQKLIKAEES